MNMIDILFGLKDVLCCVVLSLLPHLRSVSRSAPVDHSCSDLMIEIFVNSYHKATSSINATILDCKQPNFGPQRVQVAIKFGAV